jgi:hypothetical protein
MNHRHLCIADSIGVVLPSPSCELQIVRMYYHASSLSDVILVLAKSWIPTAEVKAVVALVLRLRFSRTFGLLHSHLTVNNLFSMRME